MNNINQTADELLKQRRIHHQMTLRQRQQEVYDKIPKIREIDNAINAAYAEFTQAAALKNPDAVTHFRDRATLLQKEKANCLQSAGYPADYLKLHYSCPHCKDKGYINGKLCSCLKQARIQAAYAAYDLTQQAQSETFDSFNVRFYPDNAQASSPREKMKGIRQRMLAFCENFDTESDNFFFIGSPGTGKTFLSNCIANHLIHQGKSVIYLTAAHLIADIQSKRFGNQLTEAEILAPFETADLLIIDDFGAEHITDYSKKLLFEIINIRLLNNKRMVISSNLTMQEIFCVYDERLTSRLRGNFRNFLFEGEDIRLLKKRMHLK